MQFEAEKCEVDVFGAPFCRAAKNNSLSDVILLLQSLEFEFEISKSQAYDLRKRPFAHLGKVTSTEIWARKIVK